MLTYYLFVSHFEGYQSGQETVILFMQKQGGPKEG